MKRKTIDPAISEMCICTAGRFFKTLLFNHREDVEQVARIVKIVCNGDTDLEKTESRKLLCQLSRDLGYTRMKKHRPKGVEANWFKAEIGFSVLAKEEGEVDETRLCPIESLITANHPKIDWRMIKGLIDDEFSIRLRIARMDSGLGQKELAAISGTSIQRISHYETGKCKPSISIGIRLSNALKVKFYYLLFGKADSESCRKDGTSSGSVCSMLEDLGF